MALPLINITRKQATTFAGFLVLYEFLTYIANDMIMPGMIQVVASFHAPESDIASSLTAYVLGGASLQLLLGPISDRYGRRPVMLFGACLFFVCTAFIACSHSIHHFLIARFFEGMGLCFISVVGYAVLQEIFAEMDAIRMISIMSSVSILAPLLGPLAGAAFIHYFSWRLIFVCIGALALLALWGLWRFMPESIGQMTRDGQLINPSKLSVRVVAANYRTLVCNFPFMLSAIAYGILGVPCIAWIALSPVIMVTEAKLSLIEYGLWQIPVFSAAILGNVILSRITHYFSVIQLIAIGSVMATVSLCLMYILPLMMGDHYIGLIPGLVLYMCGYSIAATPLNRFILFATHLSKGTVSALLSMIIMCSQAVGIEIANYLYQTHNDLMFGACCAVMGLLYALLLFVAFLVGKRQLAIPS